MVILVRIQSKCWKIRTRINPNTIFAQWISLLFFNLTSRGLFIKPGTNCMHFIVISVVIFSSFSVFVTKVSLEELGLLEKKFSAKQDHNKFSLKHYNMQRKFKGQLFQKVKEQKLHNLSENKESKSTLASTSLILLNH